MFQFLDRIRRSSVQTRQRFALGFAAGSTGIIFFLWLSLGPMTPTTAEAERVPGPWAALKESAATIVTRTTAGLGSMKASLAETKEVLLLQDVMPDSVSASSTTTHSTSSAPLIIEDSETVFVLPDVSSQ